MVLEQSPRYLSDKSKLQNSSCSGLPFVLKKEKQRKKRKNGKQYAQSIWKEANYQEDWWLSGGSWGTGEKGGRETFSICSFEPYSLKKKTKKPSILKDCEPAAASIPCLEMKLRQRPAGLDMEKPITDDIIQAPGSCCFQSLSSHVSPQSLLSGLSLSEPCWQVSWSLAHYIHQKSRWVLHFFPLVLLRCTWQTFLSFFFFLLCFTACGILVPRPGIECAPSAVNEQTPNHWTTRELPMLCSHELFSYILV